jgi:hypothetical protein
MVRQESAERSETGRSRSSQRLAIQIVKPTFLRRSMIGSTGGQRAFAGAAGNGEVAPEADLDLIPHNFRLRS